MVSAPAADPGVKLRSGASTFRPFLDEREEELYSGIRSGHVAQADDRPLRGAVRSGRRACAAAVSSGTNRSPSAVRLSDLVGRRGDYDLLVRGKREQSSTRGAVFADIDPQALNVDPAAVEAAVTSRTKAILAVDIFGYPCELDELRAIADAHGLAFVQDHCGRSVTASLQGRRRLTGRAVFAFYRTSRSRPARAAW
jgi:hypothetical protein